MTEVRRDLPATDVLGQPLTDVERQVMELYLSLKSLVARPDLSPSTAQNLRKALACLWQVTNNLDLQFEQLYDVGV